MKHEQWTSRLVALAMAFFLALAGVGCIVTGFALNADLGAVGWNILIAAILIIVANNFRWGNWILAVVIALFVNHLWRHEGLEDSVEGLVYWISVRFNGAYRWGVVFWSAEPPERADLEMALSVMTIPGIWVTVWTIIKRKPAFFAVPVAILLPAICFVITNTVPATWCLFLLCLTLLLLVLTQTVRRREAKDGNRLLALLLIPALLCTSLLFWAVPMEGYSPRFETPQWLQNLMTGQGPIIGGTDPGTAVDLRVVGPKSEARTEIMRVKSTRPGVIYLRGQAYDQYEGATWSVSNVDTTQDRYWPTKNMVSSGEITITTRTEQRLRYVPYYIQNGAWMDQIRHGRLEGAATKEYTFPIMDRVGSSNLNTGIMRDALVEQCLQLPESTSVKAKEIAKQIGIAPTYSRLKKAQIISEYVSELVKYDTQTNAMPDDQEDFAIWFLTEAQSGYCVHFATAATILLRASGVPARYVTGYMINVGSGFGIVEQRHAHAWVEYLDDNRGWVVLDPTPVGDQPDVTEPTEPNPTKPSESTEPTTPTGPSESTEPSMEPSTEPTIETEPSESTVPQESRPVQGQTVTQRDWSWLWNILKYMSLILGPIALTAGQYFLRISLRKRKRRKAANNEKALLDWKEVNLLSRLMKQPISEELEELAEKAKFSQYTLTAAEIDIFRNRITQLREVLRSKNWFRRLVLKLVFALE